MRVENEYTFSYKIMQQKYLFPIIINITCPCVSSLQLILVFKDSKQNLRTIMSQSKGTITFKRTLAQIICFPRNWVMCEKMTVLRYTKDSKWVSASFSKKRRHSLTFDPCLWSTAMWQDKYRMLRHFYLLLGLAWPTKTSADDPPVSGAMLGIRVRCHSTLEICTQTSSVFTWHTLSRTQIRCLICSHQIAVGFLSLRWLLGAVNTSGLTSSLRLSGI